jgi:transcription antitermination factor NusA-like protein
LKDDNEESGDELTEEARPRIRTMVIRGLRERIKHAEVLIKKIIDEQPVLETITVEVPQRVIGRIIGKGGKTIRQLSRISGTLLVLQAFTDQLMFKSVFIPFFTCC